MSQLIIPSYSSGFARYAAESEYPELWRGVRAIYEPALGPTGGTLYDWSGWGNDATLVNMEVGADWVAAERGYALDLDGGNEYVQKSAPVFAADISGTISFWMYYHNAGTDCIIYVGDSGSNDNFLTLNLASNEKFSVRVKTNSDIVNVSKTAGGVIPINTWTHLAYASNPNGNKLYMNGQEIIGLSYTSGSAATHAWFGQMSGIDAITIGARSIAARDRYFDGFIGQVLVYDRVLTANEMAAIYAGASPLIPKGRVVGYVAAVVGGVVPQIQFLRMHTL